MLAVAALGAALIVLLDKEDDATVVASTGTADSCDDPPFRPTYLPAGWDPALADREITTAEDGIRSTWWQPGSADEFIRVVDGHSTFPQVPELTEQMVVLGHPAWIGPFTADGGFSVEFQACERVWSLNSQGIGEAELRRIAEGLRRAGQWSDAPTGTALTVTPRSGPSGLGILVEGRGFGNLGDASPDGVPVYLVRRDGDQVLRGLIGHARPEPDGTFRLAGTVPATLTPAQPGDDQGWETTPGRYEVVVGSPDSTPTLLPFEVDALVLHTASYPHRVLLGCGPVSTFLGGDYWTAEPFPEHAEMSGPTPGFFNLRSEDEADFLLGDYQTRPPIRFRRLHPGEPPPPAASCASEGPSKGPAPVPPPCPPGRRLPRSSQAATAVRKRRSATVLARTGSARAPKPGRPVARAPTPASTTPTPCPCAATGWHISTGNAGTRCFPRPPTAERCTFGSGSIPTAALAGSVPEARSVSGQTRARIQSPAGDNFPVPRKERQTGRQDRAPQSQFEPCAADRLTQRPMSIPRSGP